MRADLPRPPMRSPAAGAAPEDLRTQAATASEAATRRRDEAGGRRQASANRLMAAVTRQLQDSSEAALESEETAVERGDGGGGAAAAGDGAVPLGAARSGKGAAPPRMPGVGARRLVTRDGARSGRTEGTVANGASAGSNGGEAAAAASATPERPLVGDAVVDAPGEAIGPRGRIERAGRVDKVDRLGASPTGAPELDARPRRSGWGAWLFAVVALVAMLAVGWFERLGHAEGGNEAAAGAESGTRAGDDAGRSR